MTRSAAWRRLITPMAFVIGAFLLRLRVVESPEMAAQVTRGLAGPTTWPNITLWAVVLFSLLWLAQRAIDVIRVSEGSNRESPADQAPSNPFSPRIVAGIMLILGYGYLLALIGFAAASVLYLVCWLVLGGIRKPMQIGLTSLIGTTALLYLFVKLASMPMDRGVGAMGELTIALYRLLGIY